MLMAGKTVLAHVSAALRLREADRPRRMAVIPVAPLDRGEGSMA
jgi:hypothetical protein